MTARLTVGGHRLQTARHRLRIALELAMRRVERQAPLPVIVGDLQDAISDVAVEITATTRTGTEYQ